MGKKSLIIWISDEANEIIVKELNKINEGKANRRGDDILTKSERCSQIIDEYYEISHKSHLRSYPKVQRNNHE